MKVLTSSRLRLYDMRRLSYFVTIDGKLHLRTQRKTCLTPWRFDPKASAASVEKAKKEMLGLDFTRKTLSTVPT